MFCFFFVFSVLFFGIVVFLSQKDGIYEISPDFVLDSTCKIHSDVSCCTHPPSMACSLSVAGTSYTTVTLSQTRKWQVTCKTLHSRETVMNSDYTKDEKTMLINIQTLMVAR